MSANVISTISIFIAAISAFFAIFFGVQNYKRNKNAETKADASQNTAVLIKLETISVSLQEIKVDMSGTKTDIKDIRERLILNEASTKQAHKRLDEVAAKRS